MSGFQAKMSYRGISKQENLVNVLKYLSHISKLNEGEPVILSGGSEFVSGLYQEKI